MIQPTCETLAPGVEEIDPELDYMLKLLGTYTFTHPGWKKAFDDCSRQDVLYTLMYKLRDENITVLLLPDRTVGGYIIYTPDEITQTLYVEHILGSAINTMRGFAIAWIKSYPGWRVVGRRNGETKEYDFENFVKRYM